MTLRDDIAGLEGLLELRAAVEQKRDEVREHPASYLVQLD